MLRRFRCIIFDKDGTLFCSKNMTKVWSQAITHGILSIPTVSIKKKNQAILNINNYLPTHLEQETWAKIEEDIAKEIVLASNESLDLAKSRIRSWTPPRSPQGIKPGVMEFLKIWPHKTALLTSDDYKPTMLDLNRFNLDFDIIVTGDQVTKGKPDPEGLNKILNELQVSPKETCIIGDSHADIALKKTGKLGGAFGVRTNHESIPGACLMVDDISELLSQI